MEPQGGNAQRSVEVTISGGKHSKPVFGNQTVNTDSVVHHHHGDDYPNATIHQHYYGPNQPPGNAVAADSPGARHKEQTIPEGYDHLCDNIYLNNKEPLKRGASVFRAFQQHANGRRQSLAIKVIFPCQERNFREVECLLTLASHPNIVQIIRSEKRDIPAGFVLYIIMELCGDKNLQDYLNENRDSPLDYDKTMSFSKQLVDAVKHIHRNNIVHRDLKPENILLLLDGEHLKVTDFGISKELREGRSVTKQTDLAGTDGYRAPETLRDGSISKKADIFSLGIMLALLWSNGKHAYGEKVHSRNHNILENIAPDLSGLLIPGKEKDELRSLLLRMLSPDPSARPTIEEVFQDAFFADLAVRGPGADPVQTLEKCLLEHGVEVHSHMVEQELCHLSKGKFGDDFVTIRKYAKEDTRKLKYFTNAFNALKVLKHENIVRFVMQIPELGVILTEYCHLGTLRDFLRDGQGRESESSDLMGMAIQVASAMAYLHSMEFCYFHLLAQNVAIDVKRICKLSDFSLTQRLGKDKVKYRLAILAKWASPESALTRKPSKQNDVWSFGVTLWEIFSLGKVPYPGLPNNLTLEKVRAGYRMDKPDKCPPEIYRDVMKACWARVPKERPTFTWLKEYLLSHANEQNCKESEGAGPVQKSLLEHGVEMHSHMAEGELCHLLKGKFGGDFVTIHKYAKEDTSKLKYFTNASNALKVLKHENIVRCIMQIPDLGVILTEYCHLGTLRDFLRDGQGRESETSELVGMAIQVASAMAYLHSMEYTYFQLMAQNVAIDVQRICKLSDFSFTLRLGKDEVEYPLKYPMKWASPEFVLSGKPSKQNDVWSFGVTLWEIFSLGKFPYPGFSNRDTLEVVRDGYRMDKPDKCPPEIYRDVMKACWAGVPEERPTFTWLKKYLLSHANEGNWKGREGKDTIRGSTEVVDTSKGSLGFKQQVKHRSGKQNTCPKLGFKHQKLTEMRQSIQKMGMTVHTFLRDFGFGQTWKGQFSGRDVTISMYYEMYGENFSMAIKALKAIKHDNVVVLLKTITDIGVIVTEYFSFGTLQEFLSTSVGKKVEPIQLVGMAAQIACGMAHVHGMHFLHCDLRSANISVGSNLVCKISNFSRAQYTRITEHEFTYLDEPNAFVRWAAPECLEYGRAGFCSDCWSFGIVMWEMLTRGRKPYPNLYDEELKDEVLGGYRLWKPENCPSELFCDVLQECWKTAGERPSFVQLEKTLLAWLGVRNAGHVWTLEETLQAHGVEVESYLHGAELCLLLKGRFDGDFVTIHKYAKEDPGELKCFTNAANALDVLKHEHVVQLVTKIPEICVVMTEHCTHGSLCKYLRNGQGTEAQLNRLICMAEQVASGMEFIHQLGYVHCDLKARNIFVGENLTCKISGFNLAQRVGDAGEVRLNECWNNVSIRWAARELFKTKQATFQSDIWSFGVLLWEIVTYGQKPFVDYPSIITSILRGHRLMKPKQCPNDLYFDVMRACWDENPEARPRLGWLRKTLLKFASFEDLEVEEERTTVRALFDYEPDGQDQLAFKEGDVIVIHEVCDRGWSYGELDGEKGYLPTSHTIQIRNESARKSVD